MAGFNFLVFRKQRDEILSSEARLYYFIIIKANVRYLRQNIRFCSEYQSI